MKLRTILGVSLCAFILSTGLISCSDDDDKKVEPTVISGTFKFTKSEADVTVTDPAIKDKSIEATNTFSKGGTYVFKLDGTFQSKETTESEAVDGTYKLEGDKLTLTDESGTTTLAYTENSIRRSQDVTTKVTEKLELENGIVTKAIQTDVFDKVTK